MFTNAYSLYAQLDNAIGDALLTKYTITIEGCDDGRNATCKPEYIEKLDEWNAMRKQIATYIRETLPEVCKEYHDMFLFRDAKISKILEVLRSMSIEQRLEATEWLKDEHHPLAEQLYVGLNHFLEPNYDLIGITLANLKEDRNNNLYGKIVAKCVDVCQSF